MARAKLFVCRARLEFILVYFTDSSIFFGIICAEK